MRFWIETQDGQSKRTSTDNNREKLLKLDARSREYDIVVVGEEPHLAYNRVGLTSFFEHRKIEDLYLNPKDWVTFPDAICLTEITDQSLAVR